MAVQELNKLDAVKEKAMQDLVSVSRLVLMVSMKSKID
jgi:hypothetical protein